MAVSDKPWGNFSQADYTPEQWARACLIDTGQGEGKQRYKLPVREPDGAVNRNAVHAAASVLAGGRGGVDASPEQKAAAARKLRSMYSQMNEDPPESLMSMGSRGQAGQGELRMAERLFTPVPVEYRGGAKAESRMIGGYAAVFGKPTKMPGFIEQVRSSAFNRNRAAGWPDVISRFNHNDDLLLGATRSGTLRLLTDNVGLDYAVDLSASRQDVLEMIRRGDVGHSSFAFMSLQDDWGMSEQGYPQRSLVEVQLIDVGPVTQPAYSESTVGLRSLAAKFEADVEEVRSLAERDELRRFFVRTDNKGSAKPKLPTYGPAARMAILARRRPASI